MYVIQTNKNASNLKINYKGYEISIVFERIGDHKFLTKSDMRIYKGESDYTYKFDHNNLYRVGIEDIFEVIKHIDYLESDRYIDPIEDDRQNELKEMEKHQKEFLAGFNQRE